MKAASPLRYPGGKATMTGLLTHIRRLNRLGGLPVAEPFAGGAGAALSLLYMEETSEILINDADRAMHDLWWSLVKQPEQFLDLLDSVPINIAEWIRQRDVYQQKRHVSRLERGFAAFYLNRCNRSGIIINGGPIGGIEQKGRWKINARFNKDNLLKRCQKIAEYRDRIHVSNQDGVEFIKESEKDTLFFFIDPPYFHKGETLYMNLLGADYHTNLAKLLKSRANQPWILTYDDCPEIRNLYKQWATVRPFSLRYSATKRRQGKEVLITPKWMILPDTQQSTAISW